MRHYIDSLKDKHKGEDIWIIASGASMDTISPEFFEGKTTICVNATYKKYPATYIVRKEQAGAETAAEYANGNGSTLVMSKGDCGSMEKNPAQEGALYFTHKQNECTSVDLDVIGTEKIVVSWSTITSAMHLAAFMGAKNVLLCGHDCGLIDGEANYYGYGERPNGDYETWLSKIEVQSALVRDRLEEVYGCEIHSLNPWLNVGLEGHKYEVRT